MNVPLEKKKSRAIELMQHMGLWQPVIDTFRDEGKVLISEPPFGAVYEMDDKLANQVKEFESEHNALVYMVIRAFTEVGQLDSLLYVSDYEDEWSYEDEDIPDHIVMTYTINQRDPIFSEFGSISFKIGVAGCPVRI